MTTNTHWHITADGQQEQIITVREIVRAKVAEAASYLSSNALTVAGSYSLRIWTCRDADCLPFDAEGEERRKQEELARLPEDPSEEHRRKFDPYNLDGGGGV